MLDQILRRDAAGVPTNADKDSRASVLIAQGVLEQLGDPAQEARMAGQVAGSKFEWICLSFLEQTFPKLNHLRPGKWTIKKGTGRGANAVADYSQYQHLRMMEEAARKDHDLASVIGLEYGITPDIVIARSPEPEDVINSEMLFAGDDLARKAIIRKINSDKHILHASISCKWTIRSDRAQNSRSEALNFVRDRKGPQPHIAVITAEPLPARLASIVLGTGDIDCVYHFALPELEAAVAGTKLDDAKEMLSIMVRGNRLRDIADLPLDLAV